MSLMKRSNAEPIPTPFDEVKYPSFPGKKLPRRYEDMKVAKLQDSSHQKIIEIGTEIDTLKHDQQSAKLADALTRAEDAIWAQAHVQEEKAMDELRKEAAGEQDRIVRKMKLESDKLLQEELTKLDERMREQENERMRIERLEAHRRLREAVRSKEEECEQKLAHMVAETRKQEQQLATVELARIERENKERLEKAILEKEEERTQAVMNMVAKMMAERDKAVEEARAEEAKKLQTLNENLKRQQEKERRKVDEMVIEHTARLEAMEEDLNHGKICQTNLQNKLLSLHHSFHDYVDATSKNNVKGRIDIT